MTAHPRIHAIHDQGPARRKTPAPILLACMKSDVDADRDHVNARRDAIAAIDAEEAELLKVDSLLASKQYGLDRRLVERR